MSTKIFNGFEFSNPDFLEADRLVRAFRPVVHSLQSKMYSDYVAARAIRILDAALLDIATGHRSETEDQNKRTRLRKEDSPLFAARYELMDMSLRASRSPQRNPLVDAYFEVWMFACEGRLLGMVNSAREEWTRRWLRTPGVRALPYWNNSDRPSGITAKDWEERGRLWDVAIGPSGVPASTCWTAQLHQESLVLDGDLQRKAAALVPRMSTRLHESRVLDGAAMLLTRAQPVPDSGPELLFNLQNNRSRVRKGSDPDAVSAREVAQTALPACITAAMIRQPIPETAPASEPRSVAPQT